MSLPLSVWRILDANLNRALEGLRVVEDFLRLDQEDRYLAGCCKTLRHQLAEIAQDFPSPALLLSRDSQADVGRLTKAADEFTRADLSQVIRASWKRCQQALRCLEEYGKLVTPQVGERIEALRYEAYTLEKACYTTSRGRSDFALIPLCVLLDARESLDAFQRIAEELIAAHVPLVQLRLKNLSDREWLTRARTLRAATRGTGTRMIVNDRVDIAALVGADGVHLGQDDLQVSEARRIVGPDCWIGVSTHNLTQVHQAVRDGADYLGAGPTFPSTTKAFDTWAGTAFLQQVASEVTLPTFAIGGITLENLPQVLATGVRRIAVQGSLLQATNPGAVAREFLKILSAGPR